MKTIYQLEDLDITDEPLSLTIGNFDGLHLGHRAIFSKLRKKKVVLTFANHPSEVLENKKQQLISTHEHKLQLLRNENVDISVILPFTDSFAKQSPEEFLVNIRKKIAFSNLVLGSDAVFGFNRGGNKECISTLSKRFNFGVDYIEPVLSGDFKISSRTIRDHIKNGEFEAASALLGRPYSIMNIVEKGHQAGRILGMRTANISVEGLCLPPLGVYKVKTKLDGKTYLGLANLGTAPTIHKDRSTLLEVHILGYEGDLYGCSLDVVFLKFLRPERKFNSTEDLVKQIQSDRLNLL